MIVSYVNGVRFSAILFLSFYFSIAVYSQTTDVATDAALSEKIYLQTDGDVYTNDQTIWFKAIVTNAIDHTPTLLSGVLYVELVSFSEVVMQRKILKIEGGTTSGSFELDDSYASGRYLLRAYTEWSKNFGSDFYYQSYLYVFLPKDNVGEEVSPISNVVLDRSGDGLKLKASLIPIVLDSLHEKRLMVYLTVDDKEDSVEIKESKNKGYQLEYELLEQADLATIKIRTSTGLVDSKTILINDDAMDLQFFPESGSLVDGLISKVGFKAVSPDGKGKQVRGTIVNEGGEELTTFESNSLGMGALVLQAKQSDTYYAKVSSTTDDNLDVLYPLPKVNPEGTIMSIRTSNGMVSVRVSSSNMQNDSVYVQVSRRGMIYFDIKGKLNEEGELQFNVSSEQLPEGIVAFNLSNQQSQPLASRLYFNEKGSERLNITIASDKPSYLQREKTKLKAKVTDNNGELVDAKLSVLVLNKKQLGDLQQKRENILSYFLMNSELKGHIEDPGYYFRTENESRLRDLDVLMLTQGWSNYKYEALNLPENQQYQPELSLTVSGRVTDLIKDRKVQKGVDLTMTTFGEIPSFDTQLTDDSGRFSFNVSDAFGESMPVLIQTKKKGKKSSYTITLDEKLSPKVRFNHEVSVERVDSTIYELVEKHQERKLVDDAYDFSTRVRDLGEVIVEDYALTPLREQVMKEYGKPDIVIGGDEIREQEQKWTSGLYDVLRTDHKDKVEIYPPFKTSALGPYRGKTIVYAQVRGMKMTTVLVDGIPVTLPNYDLLSLIPVSEVKSFEIIKYSSRGMALITKLFWETPIPSPPKENGILSIYTYAGTGLSLRGTKGIFHGAVPAFSFEREFYAPKYENLSAEDWVKPDYRSLVHWLSDALTNDTGMVETEFYNADNLGEMLVVVEAISASGQIGYQELVFNVEQRKR